MFWRSDALMSSTRAAPAGREAISMNAKRAKDQQPMIEAEERNAQARIDSALRKRSKKGVLPKVVGIEYE